MDRRGFIRMSMAGSAMGIIMPKTVFAGVMADNISKNKVAGGVFYTAAAPGRWEKKAGSHAPILEKSGDSVKVVTSHPMDPGKHWIIKHVLLDSQFKFIEENIFDPSIDKAAVSDFSVLGRSGPVYALSVCNLHDTWLSSIDV